MGVKGRAKTTSSTKYAHSIEPIMGTLCKGLVSVSSHSFPLSPPVSSMSVSLPPFIHLDLHFTFLSSILETLFSVSMSFFPFLSLRQTVTSQ